MVNGFEVINYGREREQKKAELIFDLSAANYSHEKPICFNFKNVKYSIDNSIEVFNWRKREQLWNRFIVVPVRQLIRREISAARTHHNVGKYAFGN